MAQRIFGMLKLAAGLTAMLIHVAGSNAGPSVATAFPSSQQTARVSQTSLRRDDRFAEIQRLFGVASRNS